MSRALAVLGVTLSAVSLGYLIVRDRSQKSAAIKPGPPIVPPPPLPIPTPTPPPPTPSPELEPYESYTRGPFVIDLAGLTIGTRWRVFHFAAIANTKPTDALSLGHGVEADDEDARVAANAFVDHLPIPDADSSGATATGTTASATMRMHGLRVENCRDVFVEDVARWAAWAAPRLQAGAESTPAADLVGEVFGEAFPSCALELDGLYSAGAPMVERIEAADNTVLRLVREGHPIGFPPPGTPNLFEVAAAGLVGATAPNHGIGKWAYHGRLVEVVDVPGQLVFKWRAWDPNRARSMPFASGQSASVDDAVNAARAAVDRPEVGLSL